MLYIYIYIYKVFKVNPYLKYFGRCLLQLFSYLFIYLSIYLLIYLFIFHLFIYLYTVYHETLIQTIYSIVPWVYTSDFFDVRFCVTYQPYQKLKNDMSYTNILTLWNHPLIILGKLSKSVKKLFEILHVMNILNHAKKNTFQKALNNIYSKEKETYMIPTGKNQND